MIKQNYWPCLNGRVRKESSSFIHLESLRQWYLAVIWAEWAWKVRKGEIGDKRVSICHLSLDSTGNTWKRDRRPWCEGWEEKKLFWIEVSCTNCRLLRASKGQSKNATWSGKEWGKVYHLCKIKAGACYEATVWRVESELTSGQPAHRQEECCKRRNPGPKGENASKPCNNF